MQFKRHFIEGHSEATVRSDMTLCPISNITQTSRPRPEQHNRQQHVLCKNPEEGHATIILYWLSILLPFKADN